VPLSIGLSLGAALLLQRAASRAGSRLFRTALFAPVVTTLVAVAVIWRYLLHTRYGLINYALAAHRHRSGRLARRSALGDAGDHPVRRVEELRLQHGDPARRPAEHPGEELYEAARIDGAGAWQQFRHVTLPMLGPTLLLVGILTMAGYFQLFAEPYVMTQGGPLRSTVSVSTSCTRKASSWWNLGYASAVAFVLFLSSSSRHALQQLRRDRGGERMNPRLAGLAVVNGCSRRHAAVDAVPAAVDGLGLAHAGRARRARSAAAAAPQPPTLEQLPRAVRARGMGRYLLNSAAVAVRGDAAVAALQRRWPATRSPSCAFAARPRSSGAARRAGDPRAGRDAAALPDAEAARPGQQLRRRDRAGDGEHLRHLPRAPVRAVDPRRPARGGAHRRRGEFRIFRRSSCRCSPILVTLAICSRFLGTGTTSCGR
jgi:hypothetical protein